MGKPRSAQIYYSIQQKCKYKSFTSYANILDHLENIRDKKILILEERDRHLGMIGVVNHLIQQKSKKELFMATHILHLFNHIK